MDTQATANVNGQPLESVVLRVPARGAWVANCVSVQAPALAGAVTLTIGNATLRGTVVADRNGTYGGVRSFTVVGGAGGWHGQLSAKDYHNDAGVKAAVVAADAARDAGEVLGTFVPAATTIGIDYVRDAAASAARALEDSIGGAAWWVDYNGKTNVGPRTTAAIAVGACEVTAYNPGLRVIELALNDVAALQVGSVLSALLDSPQTVQSYDIHCGAELTARCYVGATDTDLAATFSSLVRRCLEDKLVGMFRYRVVGMAGQRVQCQAVRKAAGLPDIAPISMWPGVAGAHAELANGAEVLVEFIEGDRSAPVITHFAGADGIGFVPVSLALAGGGPAAARVGDAISAGGPGTLITFQLDPPPPGPPSPVPLTTLVPYLVSFDPSPPTETVAAAVAGTITSGSAKVTIG